MTSLIRRSKRFKSTQDSQVLSDSNTPPAKALAVNTKGLPTLPDELYLEIISCYPASPIPIPRNIRRPDINNQDAVRRKVLFALSQTSVNLRRFFLCYLWQRIEVCATHAPIKSRKLALELIRQLEIVTIRDPSLAKYVEIVNVEIGVYSRPSVLAELARCLALFPNLHTVQLKIKEDTSIQHDPIAKPFKGYVYQNIHTVVVSRNALTFLKSCPQSRRVDSYDYGFYPSTFWDVVATCCPRLEVAACHPEIPVGRLPEIAKIFPELRNLTLWQNQFFCRDGQVNKPVYDGLVQLKRLQVLTIVGMLEGRQDVKGSPLWMCCEMARKLLLDLQRTDKEDKVFVLKFQMGRTKTVVLRYREPSPG